MMKKWSWILMAIMAVIASLAITAASLEGNHRRSLQKQVKEQSVIIDSLLQRRMTVFDVQLHVTDKSVNKIYGRYNKGTISMPQERKYILEVDSVSMRVKNRKFTIKMAKKQEEQTKTPQQTEWPVVKDGKFVCSDGQEFADGYFASEHQKQLNKQ